MNNNSCLENCVSDLVQSHKSHQQRSKMLTTSRKLASHCDGSQVAGSRDAEGRTWTGKPRSETEKKDNPVVPSLLCARSSKHNHSDLTCKIYRSCMRLKRPARYHIPLDASVPQCAEQCTRNSTKRKRFRRQNHFTCHKNKRATNNNSETNYHDHEPKRDQKNCTGDDDGDGGCEWVLFALKDQSWVSKFLAATHICMRSVLFRASSTHVVYSHGFPQKSGFSRWWNII